jgi:hypothetical protein
MRATRYVDGGDIASGIGRSALSIGNMIKRLVAMGELEVVKRYVGKQHNVYRITVKEDNLI